MYKKFLVSMLLAVALTGCGHQSSDKQGDQMDTALPIQDQLTNPAPDNGVNGTEPAKPACPTPAEPTQTTPGITTDGTHPNAGTTTPAMPNVDNSSSAITAPASDIKDAAGKLKDAASKMKDAISK